MVAVVIVSIVLTLIGIAMFKFTGENGRCFSLFLMAIGIGTFISIVISALIGGITEASVFGMQTVEKGTQAIKFESQIAWAFLVWGVQLGIVAIIFIMIGQVQKYLGRLLTICIMTAMVLVATMNIFPIIGQTLLWLIPACMMIFIFTDLVDTPINYHIMHIRYFAQGIIYPAWIPYITTLGLGATLITMGINPIWLLSGIVMCGVVHAWVGMFEGVFRR